MQENIHNLNSFFLTSHHGIVNGSIHNILEFIKNKSYASDERINVIRSISKSEIPSLVCSELIKIALDISDDLRVRISSVNILKHAIHYSTVRMTFQKISASTTDNFEIKKLISDFLSRDNNSSPQFVA